MTIFVIYFVGYLSPVLSLITYQFLVISRHSAPLDSTSFLLLIYQNPSLIFFTEIRGQTTEDGGPITFIPSEIGFAFHGAGI